MRMSAVFSVACLVALAACSRADDESTSSEVIAAAANSVVSSEVAAPPETETSLAVPLPAALPKLAYVYGLGYELPADGIGKLMRRHADLCEQQGPASCRIIGMDLSGSPEREDASGRLQLAVAAPHARALTALLEKEAEGFGAEQTATTIGSEEVSKTIVDTEARIRAREELRDRLTDVLRTSRGSVKDIVEAERQVAAVNEEIDQARSWLAETRGRVVFSRLDVDYASRAGGWAAFTSPVEHVVGSLGGVLGFIVAALLAVGTALLPIAGLAWAAGRLRRYFAAPS